MNEPTYLEIPFDPDTLAILQRAAAALNTSVINLVLDLISESIAD
jgi:uncharacterized protein (DUF1778 family)